MLKDDQDFLSAMWNKVENREADLRLFEVVRDLPETPDMPGLMRNIFTGMGLKQLFFGMADVFAVAFALCLILFFFAARVISLDTDNIYAVSFISAPFFYGVIFLLGWLKEKQTGCYDVLMSCKYTFFHLLTARMLGSSVIGLLFNFGYMTVLWMKYPAGGLRLFAVSFSSLMLFALLLAITLEKGKSMTIPLAAALSWIVLNLAGFMSFRQTYCDLLNRVPLLLLLLAAAAAAVFYLHELVRLTTLSFRKEYVNASR